MVSPSWITCTYPSTLIHGFEYIFRSAKLRRYPCSKGHRCTPVVVSAAGSRLRIPCPNCTDFRRSVYQQFVRDGLAGFVNLNFPTIPLTCVLEVANTFVTSILKPSLRNHRCPLRRSNAKTSTVNAVIIEIQERMEVSFVEVVPLTKKPASESWLEIEVIKKAIEEDDLGEERFESGWNATDHECVICFEDISKRIDSLTMPCSHVFHQDCIVPWPKTSHLCPLCRHEMPTDD